MALAGSTDREARGAPGLFDRPRTGDEDIDQSPRALLPARAGRNIGNADQSAKEIDRVKVFTYVAAFDGAFRQRAHRFPGLCVRSFEHPLGNSNQGIQRRRDDLLRRDVVHEQQHPGSQGFNRGHGFGKVPLRSGQLFDLRPINRRAFRATDLTPGGGSGLSSTRPERAHRTLPLDRGL